MERQKWAVGGGAGNVLRSVLIRGEDRGSSGSGIICYTTQRGQRIACRAVIEGERDDGGRRRMTNCQVWTDHKKGEEGVCLGYLLGL